MSGIRAEQAALLFKEKGYTKVFVYPGGWKEWAGWSREQWETWAKETGYPLGFGYIFTNTLQLIYSISPPTDNLRPLFFLQ